MPKEQLVAPFGNCGAVRRAKGEEFSPHATHKMRDQPTGSSAFDNACTACGGRMWGVPDDWDHDITLEKPCVVNK